MSSSKGFETVKNVARWFIETFDGEVHNFSYTFDIKGCEYKLQLTNLNIFSEEVEENIEENKAKLHDIRKIINNYQINQEAKIELIKIVLHK